ncbi:MAG: 50S ribosomal protein L23 [Cycloclasticus pugetii]|jgi:large subunit ribosomal protein L23|uniref:Large ribosomal subunit protein uL23 n=2 Tax=Cycloclasticus TaxID=34067 RepID=S5TVP4_9GAMM|nr:MULTISPECIES: 50S ribosomal protein L23 [Cycloclasticus]AFT67747.1 50S ribosomal protein L23 [Cycloclasticus sp. P1]AGS39083.1 50S ribosomal protein L23 [Cycloclasticus zancles 78-ME]ATI02709.1 50S ribosomal protein L23 [Cycloclasticus sp. PY97N]EPD13453.1 50S ribosomal protein L23 [Cycloclasticus pugetii]MBV1897802.1 50S ribosomal protein L23 [Cycloclasticus sp.]|tara:strand:- start:1672 stop:1965 length:294 start_codon:yes stop_codon:yes gene_type:complete
MNQEFLLQLITAPVVTEKSSIAADLNNQYVFKVDSSANKADIKAAVEKLFSVDVESVKTLNVKGKVKRFGKGFGKRSDVKKAYVRIKSGQEIEFVSA